MEHSKDSELHKWLTLDGYVPPLEDRLHNITKTLRQDKEAADAFPGLAELLEKVRDPAILVEQEEFIRSLLGVLKAGDEDTYNETINRYDPDEQAALESYVGGTALKDAAQGLVLGPTIGSRQEARRLASSKKINLLLAPHHNAENGVEAEHSDKTVHTMIADTEHNFNALDVSVYENAEFHNWGLNVDNIPRYTFVPRTVAGVVEIVRYAKAQHLSVRCSGYRHSWSPVFGKVGQILISTLGIDLATRLPNLTALPGAAPGDSPNDLNRIEWADESKFQVRVGCGVTNEQFRRWCNNVGGQPRAALPLNVIMVEITYGGSNAPICHGAGIKHQTLSDLVRRIEYVDANGVPQSIDEKDEGFLPAASGCFGLIGVVTHITLQLNPMTYAILKPLKMDVIRAVPPPPGFNRNLIPPMLQKKLSAKEMAEDQAAFENRALNHYYAEWFWFPYDPQIWINTWETTTDPTGVVSYPGSWGKIVQFVETFAIQVLQNSKLYEVLGEWFALRVTTLISILGMQALPDYRKDGVIKTYLPDGLHFRRSIQNVRVRDTEVEMPLQASKTNPKKVDFINVQQAWWDAIVLAYANSKTAPMRMPLEMRIMGDSNVVMAPQRGNKWGTCSIEVLSLQASAKNTGWEAFAQSVLDKWLSYKDADGKLLKTRPHWAKEWYAYKVNGKPWLEKLKNEDYKEEIVEFKGILEKIGKRDGWSLKDIQDRFSNVLFDELIYG